MDVAAPPDWIPCTKCRHRDGVGFECHSDDDARFLTGFKVGRGALAAGAAIEGSAARPILLTLYSGLALRLATRGPAALGILGVALPGDLVGLDTLLAARGGVRLEALTDITYCQFDPARWRELLERPAFAERLSRIQALARIEAEERQAAATVLGATGNLCHFLLTLYDALRRRKLAREGAFHLPFSRKRLASALGLTPLHLRRVLAGLAEAHVLDFRDGRVTLHNVPRVRALAGNPQFGRNLRPLI